MKKFSELPVEDKLVIKDIVFEGNTIIAATGLLGFAVKKLAPSKENLRKFQEQFTGHPICGCVGCIEIGKQFALKTLDIKEEIIGESMKDLDAARYH